MRKFLLISVGIVLMASMLALFTQAETTDMGEQAQSFYHFTYATNIAAGQTTFVLTNRFAYPWQLASIVMDAGVPNTNTTSISAISVETTVYKQGDVVETNDWGLVETNNYGTITNIAYTYTTNWLISSVGHTNVSKSDVYAQNLDGAYKLPSDVYFLGGDLLRIVISYTNAGMKVRIVGKR